MEIMLIEECTRKIQKHFHCGCTSFEYFILLQFEGLFPDSTRWDRNSLWKSKFITDLSVGLWMVGGYCWLAG